PRCPRVRASLEETRWAVRSSSTARVNLVVQRWSFVPPFADTPVAPLAVVGVPAEEHTGADVEYLMALLERHLVLQPEERSPDTVGAALLGLREPGGPPPADTIPLPSDSPAAAGARLLRRQALALQDTCEGAARDVDPEYVHQMRVSARRARFVLSLFGSFLGTERAAALRGELSWILGTLGPVRDMDVLAERLPDLLERVEAAASVRAGLLRVLVARRRSAFAAMKDALRGARFLALIRDLQEPPSAGEAPPSPPGSPAPTAAVFASQRIVKALSRVRDAAGADPSTLLPAELHRLRILFKRLRYTCEFFAPILTVEDVAASATVFQELLGRYQDASAAIDTLRSLAGAVPVRGGAAELTLALGALIHVHREAREKMRLRFLRTWRAHGA
ncbi:MAG TPA: CHAD domain-containing protein, partial [bacterium]|nr:CHAD domain-containing protein [bacterium]